MSGARSDEWVAGQVAELPSFAREALAAGPSLDPACRVCSVLALVEPLGEPVDEIAAGLRAYHAGPEAEGVARARQIYAAAGWDG